MKLIHIEIRGLVAAGGAPLALDLTNAPRGIVAITGANGAGKSTLIGSVLGAVYGQIPHQPRFYDVAQARDARLRAAFELSGGRFFEATRNVNGVAKQPTQDVTFTLDGMFLNDGAKATTADAWTERNLPSLNLTLATGFAAQRALGDFAEAKPSQRRAILSEIVGNEVFVDLCERSKLKLKEAEENRWKARAESDAILSLIRHNEATAPADAQDAVERAAAEASRALAALTRAEMILASRTAQREEQIAAEHRRLVDLTRATDERAKLKADIDTRTAKLDAALKDARAALDLATAEKRSADDALANATANLHRARQASNELDELDRRIETIRATDHEYEAARAAEAAAVEAVEAAATDMQKRQNVEKRLPSIETSIEHLTSACANLDAAPCGASGEYAKCPFITDAVAARTRLPIQRETYAETLAELDQHPTNSVIFIAKRDAARLATDKVNALHTYRAPLPDLVSRRDMLAVVVDDLPKLEEEVRTCDERRVKALAKKLAAAADLDDAEREQGAERDEVIVLRGALTDAEQRVKDLSTPIVPVSLDAHTHAVIQARAALDEATADKATADRNADRLRDVDEQNAKLRADVDNIDATLTKLDDDIAAWRALVEVTGPNGAPAMALALAGPEISAIANGILSDTDGGRFAVSLETLRLSADGKKWLEAFDVVVTDAKAGTSHSYETLSGGERVKVQLALRLAIGIYAERRGRERWETLLLDEPSGALDPQAGAAYVDMLRWALKAGRLDRILIITHDERIAAQADARVHIDGSVSADWT